MTMITIIPNETGGPTAGFRASTGDRESVGPTAGAALDALTEQLDDTESGTLLVVQNFQPDAFFTRGQQQRLRILQANHQRAQETGKTLSPEEQSELESLVNAELVAASQRAAAIARELGR